MRLICFAGRNRGSAASAVGRGEGAAAADVAATSTRSSNCRQIADPAQRLACYDRTAPALITASKSGEINVVDRGQLRQARRSLFGFSMPKLPFFAGDQSAGDAPDQIDTTIKSVRDRATAISHRHRRRQCGLGNDRGLDQPARAARGPEDHHPARADGQLFPAHQRPARRQGPPRRLALNRRAARPSGWLRHRHRAPAARRSSSAARGAECARRSPRRRHGRRRTAAGRCRQIMDARGLAASGHQHRSTPRPGRTGPAGARCRICAACAQPAAGAAAVRPTVASTAPSPKCSVRSCVGARLAQPASSVLPVAAGHPREAARQRPLGMGQLGHPPQRRQLLRQPRDPLVDQLAAEPPGDQVQVGARVARARGERARQPLAELVEPLDRRARRAPPARASGRRSARSARGRARAAGPGIAARDARARRAARHSSARTGTAISAAAVGVGARRSAAWSISVVSVSWPTAEISGIGNSAAARTTSSSLNAHRSSIEPPPRATISRSGRGSSRRRSRGSPRRSSPPRPRPGPAPARR